MKININSRNVLFRELKGDNYGLKSIEQDSIGYMLDIGACYGIISLMARLFHPNMQITAIEPHPMSYLDLVDNCNRMHIKTLNFALGNGEKFYLEKERKMRLCNSFKAETKDTVAIDSYTLAGLVKLSGVDDSDLAIKMDVEGAEWYMVGNCEDEEIIKKCKLIAIEVHDKNKTTLIDSFHSWFIGLLGLTHEINIRKLSSNLSIVKAVI